MRRLEEPALLGFRAVKQSARGAETNVAVEILFQVVERPRSQVVDIGTCAQRVSGDEVFRSEKPLARIKEPLFARQKAVAPAEILDVVIGNGP